MIRIRNKKEYKGDGFYVGRPSPLGNPYLISKNLSREKTIGLYKVWLLKMLESENPASKMFRILLDAYRKNGELDLICWCSPLPCHAEVVKDLIIEAANESQK